MAAKKFRFGFGDNIAPDSVAYMRLAFGELPEQCGDHALHVHDKTLRAWVDIYQTHARLMADGTKTSLARQEASAAHARRVMKEALDSANGMIGEYATLMDKASADVRRATAPPTSMGEAMIDSELRAYVRGLPSDERVKVTRQAAAENDWTLLRAVASAPALLSGLEPELHQQRFAEYAKRVAPKAFGDMETARAGVEALTKATQELQWHANHLIDFEAVDAAVSQVGRDGRTVVNPDFPTAAIPYGATP